MIFLRQKSLSLQCILNLLIMSKIGNTLAALVLGAAIGVGVGILFAPDEGKKTRKRIRKSLEGVSDNLKDKLTQTQRHFGGQCRETTLQI